jgi:hypothetical protein
MYDNYNYPEGADNEMAPWNQGENKPIEREVIATFTLSTSKPTSTTHYYCEGDKYEGYYEVTDDTDWTKEYQEQHYTPLGLINEFKTFLEEQKEKKTDKSKIHKIEWLIKECSDWNEDELEVVEE